MWTMAKRAYEASGKSDDGALPVLFIACIVGGVVTGLVEGFIGRWLSLLILFPLLLGGIAGAVGSTVVKKRNVRAPAITFLAGFVGGFLGQLTVLYLRYLMVRGEVGGELSFVDWYILSSEVGTTISRHGSDGVTLTGLGFHILTGVNFALAAGAGAFVARGSAAEPFCEVCKRWYDSDAVVHTSSGEKDALKQTIAWLEGGEMTRAKKESPPPTEKRALVFTVKKCSQCESSDPVLTLKLVYNPKKKPQTTEKWSSLITREQLAQMAGS
jgi:hypothetical protein